MAFRAEEAKKVSFPIYFGTLKCWFFSFTVCIDQIKRMWVRAIYRNRQSRGEQKIIPELHDDPEKFHVYFRMSLPQFEELLSLVGPRIQKMTTTFRVPIPPRDRLAITLR